MENFKELVRTVVETGKKVNTPKGPTRRLLGATVRYDVRDTLPTVTAKKTNFKWALVEMAMFMKGVTDLSLLKEHGAEKIWEKQGLSKDLTQRLPKNPNELIDQYAKAKGLELEAAQEQFYARVGELQQQLGAVHDEGRALAKTKTSEEVNEFIANRSTEITTAFEKELTDLGMEIYADRVIMKQGELGPIYGAQWLNFPGVNPAGQPIRINQIEETIWKLENTPDSRQIIITAWNPAAIARETFSYDQKIAAGYMGQAPCHMDCQFISDESTREDGKRELSLVLHLRSNDLMLGHPFNIIGYTAFLHLMAARVGMVPNELSVIIGDAHVYENHMDKVNDYLNAPVHPLPTFKLAEGINIDNFTVEDLLTSVGDYTSEPYIPFELNV